MVSGDRNNPLDNPPNSPLKPTRHRLTVVFDRQDSMTWIGKNPGVQNNGRITDSGLADFSNNNVSITPADFCAPGSIFSLVTPGCNDYYLAPKTNNRPDEYKTKFGYYINFLSSDSGFIAKGINAPIVVANSLFYTTFTPTFADPCTGGLGTSKSWVIGDVLNPLNEDTRNVLMVGSGVTGDWNGVASNYIPLGTRGVIQGGVPLGSGDTTTKTQATPEIHVTDTDPSQRHPKPRVWRIVR